MLGLSASCQYHVVSVYLRQSTGRRSSPHLADVMKTENLPEAVFSRVLTSRGAEMRVRHEVIAPDQEQRAEADTKAQDRMSR